MTRAITMVVEVPRGSFVKYASDGSVDFVSPLVCPFNYGSMPDTKSDDGEGQDVLHIGRRAQKGARITGPLRAVVRFVDGDFSDDKWVIKAEPLTRRDRMSIRLFFTLYALVKSALRWPRDRTAARYLGLEEI